MADICRFPLSKVRIIKSRIDESLTSQPFQGKPLKERFRGLRRLKIGSYRVIYRTLEHEVVVLVFRMMHRKDVYRGILR